MSAKLKIKRGTTSAWNSTDPSIDKTLEPGQLGVEYLDDGNMRLKVGKQTADGSATAWTDLPYVTPSVSIYQDERISFPKNGKLIDKSNFMVLVKTSATESSTVRLQAQSKMVNFYSGDANNPTAFYSPSSVELGKHDSPWIKGYITDNYVQSTTYSNSMKVAYNSETEALEFISL